LRGLENLSEGRRGMRIRRIRKRLKKFRGIRLGWKGETKPVEVKFLL